MCFWMLAFLIDLIGIHKMIQILHRVLFGTVVEANVDQMKMYYGQDGKRGLHMLGVVLDDLTSSISAEDLQSKLEPYINVSTTHWLGWRVGTHCNLTSVWPGGGWVQTATFRQCVHHSVAEGAGKLGVGTNCNFTSLCPPLTGWAGGWVQTATLH